MAGQSRKWMVVVAALWVQAFTGTNFDFSAYSSELKASMGISQVQLNYLATASDLGKAIGWSSGLALAYLPLPAVLGLAALFGLAAYIPQWLLITSRISLPYLPVFLLCLLAGSSICWFNTVCFVLCIRNFPVNQSLALSLTISFNGVSAALYTLVANAMGGSPSVYLFLNAILPLIASAAALLPILRLPPASTVHPVTPDAARRDSHIFLILNALAFLTGLYLLLLHSVSTDPSTTAWVLLGGAILLLLLPLGIPGIVVARNWARRTIYANFQFDSSDLEDSAGLQKELISAAADTNGEYRGIMAEAKGSTEEFIKVDQGEEHTDVMPCCHAAMRMDRLVVLDEEHRANRLVRRTDFWLYYMAYICGATLGLVYSNNIGQIAQSLGRASQTTMLVTVYSACSFFGRLLSAAPDFLHGKVNLARTGWLAIAAAPMPVSFFLLAKDGDSEHALLAGTALTGLSSGFTFAAAVSVTSELFGPNSLGVNHNILITNIPLGSLLYGLLAALVYDSNGKVMWSVLLQDSMVVCMGRRCYAKTFLWWGCISLVGLAASIVLFMRTRSAYETSEHRSPQTRVNGGNLPVGNAC